MTINDDGLNALLLVGGRGVRLRSVVRDRPKPMAEVAGRPFVEWILLTLKAQGIRRVVFCTGHQADFLETYFQDGKQWGMKVVYSRESQPLGTAGALRHALSQIHSDPFLVLNGDSYCRFDIRRLQAAHDNASANATLWLVSVDDCRRYGSVVLKENGAIEAFREKPTSPQPGLINAGIYLLKRQVVAALPENRSVSLETAIFPASIGRGLYGVIGEGPFIDIGLPETYAAAESVFAWDTLA